MANRWENVEIVTDFLFLGSKIITDGNSSYEIKGQLLFQQESYGKLDNVWKSETLPCRQTSV